MNESRHPKFVELAPLTPTFAVHLATHLLKTIPRQTGRPRKNEMDITARTEMRLLEAMEYLIPAVQEKRQTVYDLIDPLVHRGGLTSPWLIKILNTYAPEGAVVYSQRLPEWRRGRVLFFTAQGTLDSQSVSRILLSRLLDQRRSGWLPRPTTIESYWCWRWDDCRADPIPYEMPLTIDEHDPTIVLERFPLVETKPYILSTPWRGAAWDDPNAWLVMDEGAARWVGEPTEEVLAQWLLPQEMASLVAVSSPVERAKQALGVLASRLLAHHSSLGQTD